MKRLIGYFVLAPALIGLAISQSHAADRGCELGSVLVRGADKTISDCTALIPTESDPFHLSEYYYSRCFGYMRKADYDRALADCNESIRLYPTYWAFGLRSAVYDKKGDYDRALQDIEQALVDEFVGFGYSNDASRLDQRGDVFRHKGDYDRAIRDYDSAIALVTIGIDNIEPKELAPMYYNRAFAKQAKGDIAGAEADFEEATRNSLLIRCPLTAGFILPEECPYN